tara:strand:+ start:465 stop:590 length:126 start_codon:yes stop_codon:yes gene_type:complete
MYYLNDIKFKLWDIQKNIEEEERLAQKKEELEEETKRDNSF